MQGESGQSQSCAQAQSCGQVNVGQMERLASVIAGGTILMTMAGLRSVRGVAATAIGAGMIYRGMTGHCSVYQSLGVDTAEDERAAIRENEREVLEV